MAIHTCSREAAHIFEDSKGNRWWYHYSTYEPDGRVWLTLINLDSLDFFGKYMETYNILFKTKETPSVDMFRNYIEGTWAPEGGEMYHSDYNAVDIQDKDGFGYLVIMPTDLTGYTVVTVCKYKDRHLDGELWHNFTIKLDPNDIDANASACLVAYPIVLELENEYWKYPADYGVAERRHLLRDFEQEE